LPNDNPLVAIPTLPAASTAGTPSIGDLIASIPPADLQQSLIPSGGLNLPINGVMAGQYYGAATELFHPPVVGSMGMYSPDQPNTFAAIRPAASNWHFT
jgi:hypothetical protein